MKLVFASMARERWERAKLRMKNTVANRAWLEAFELLVHVLYGWGREGEVAPQAKQTYTHNHGRVQRMRARLNAPVSTEAQRRARCHLVKRAM